jgi:hypothetical protein
MFVLKQTAIDLHTCPAQIRTAALPRGVADEAAMIQTEGGTVIPNRQFTALDCPRAIEERAVGYRDAGSVRARESTTIASGGRLEYAARDRHRLIVQHLALLLFATAADGGNAV